MAGKSAGMYADTQILRISLSDGSVTRESLPEDLYKDYLGGRGLGVKMLYDELKPGTDPLSPHNLLIFAVGPSTSTLVPTGGRSVVITKSPQTGTVLDSHAGGYIGPQIRRAGYAAIVLEGRSPKPVYLWIDDDKVEIRDATRIWGKDTYQATDILLEETDEKAQVAVIGPAGENQVLLASIMTDRHRAFGRGGVGAVMGSKNVKALVVRGTREVDVHDRERLKSVVERARLLIKKNPVTDKSLKVYGTAVLVNVTNELGMLPTYNFQEGTFNDADGVSGEKILERFLEGRYNCYGCPIGCGRITKIGEQEIGGPEYETVWALGPECGISDLEWVTLANHKCNLLGLDTISTGSTIGCAMELVQKGKLEASLRFGETDGIIDLLEDMAHKRGLGAHLSEGSKRLAERYGAPGLAMQVKGLEIPAYDPRGVQGHALGYATSNRGGCHLRSYLIGPEVLASPVVVDRDKVQGKPGLVKLYQDLSAAMDSMVVCRFTNFAWTVDDYADMVSAGTGFEMSGKDLLHIGERIWNLERLFNNREGFTAADDALPPRFFTPLPEGNSRNRVVHLDIMLPEYYKLRGWNSKGNPTKATLNRLDIHTKTWK
jgi:aldehyde:ferredoxin oxidoreductase